MKFPGFTAEASINKSIGNYSMRTGTSASAQNLVRPATNWGCLIGCMNQCQVAPFPGCYQLCKRQCHGAEPV